MLRKIENAFSAVLLGLVTLLIPISIIEDRREGFLLSMLVSPAPRISMVLGKILGAATLAIVAKHRPQQDVAEILEMVGEVHDLSKIAEERCPRRLRRSASATPRSAPGTAANG